MGTIIANKTSAINNMTEPYGEYIKIGDINTYQSQSFKTSLISYLVDQPADSNLQNSSIYPISIFTCDKQLNTNVGNITISL